ncbi:MAG: electron transport complex subunit RsxC [Lachnospiraceae bacterium]|nr:electron transport complex subunit RsxC [Lachnospiraceae bacterium]
MRKATFRGGIPICDGKKLSKDRQTMEVRPKGDAVYPLLQHIGIPARSIVEVGDRVLVGQRIAEASGVVSAHVISSVSGRVKAIEPRKIVSGAMSEAIVIENDGEFQTIDGLGEPRDTEKLSKEEIRAFVKDAGIVGLGGVGFPTHVKLTPKNDDAIEYVIVNGAESEPYLTADYRGMLEETERLVGGLKLMLRLFEQAQGIILIEKNKPEAIKMMSAALKGESRIHIKAVNPKYPRGAERQAIYAATKRKMNSSMIPTDVGCMVYNVHTVIAVYRAVAESMPLLHRVLTVTGGAVANPRNYTVNIGTSYAEVLEAAGGLCKEPEKLVSGGPMMGTELLDLTVPVTKTSSALLALSKEETAEPFESPCIRCGRCMEVCPSRLVPRKLIKCAECSDDQRFIRLGGMECSECGACSYNCPAGRSLTGTIKQMRRSILDERRRR